MAREVTELMYSSWSTEPATGRKGNAFCSALVHQGLWLWSIKFGTTENRPWHCQRLILNYHWDQSYSLHLTAESLSPSLSFCCLKTNKNHNWYTCFPGTRCYILCKVEHIDRCKPHKKYGRLKKNSWRWRLKDDREIGRASCRERVSSTV